MGLHWRYSLLRKEDREDYHHRPQEKHLQAFTGNRQNTQILFFQSEFVAPEKLEILFIKSPYIKNCYVYGNSLQSYVLATVVSEPTTVEYA